MNAFLHARQMMFEHWKPVWRWVVCAWVAFYALFMAYALNEHGGFLFVDSANLIVHEGGHLLFGWLGQTPGIWGGTILQWAVPLALAGYFVFERQLAGTAFCLFSSLKTGFTRRHIWRMRGQ
jgi:hypothetical protein